MQHEHGSNSEPNRCILTGAGSGSRWQNGGFGGAKVLATGITGVKLPDFTYGIQIE